MISDIVCQESNQAFMGSGTIQNSFSEVDIEAIQKLFKLAAAKHQIYLNSFDFNNTLLHLVIGKIVHHLDDFMGEKLARPVDFIIQVNTESICRTIIGLVFHSF
ncbi:hypothetical protein HU830_03020 [Lactobacillus sp. DCY120]|uniref:Uncharacterized protein n=1 Tax=Bombilactobacillus apium TaxID=2675299 RepID=A0A850QZN9_9LACO|nr:hypothetical protein [Bombilactobacillus apium]NVY96153.1 hypothetical protein [Bombilactobacillus apium]